MKQIFPLELPKKKAGHLDVNLCCTSDLQKIYENLFPMTHTIYPTLPIKEMGTATHCTADALCPLANRPDKGEGGVHTKHIFISLNKIIWTS